ncbi:uncharacterized protein CC84DRAFT_1180852 [Paraphaeosphaeria sporulosa]|uniref:F-box domain-containing protein n=1 Tax=Paraphaeosphaeria sporulosa TaxID=1460663 RepID=A0A177BY18_9PLEO|nr:uncharacterized protein CC84DRAFT_1180852 [Paraphaeosphaeria sporulosa]OAG00026.1 hypothetical protein CC84DRAFT_1180852 [Paraphaeosphaeria sporulosa]
MARSSQSTVKHSAKRRYIFDLPAGFAVRPQSPTICRLSRPQARSHVRHGRKSKFDFFGLPAELRKLIYSYAVSSPHNPDAGRVYLIRQKQGEYRDFTGLPLVCNAMYKEYTSTLVQNTTVTVRAEDVNEYIGNFYADRDGALKHGDMQVSYIAYGRPVAWDVIDVASRFSFKLDVSQLLKLQCRLPRMRVSFLCYSQTFINKEPMYWTQMTEDFNELFSAAPIYGPTLPGAGPIPSILPGMVEYFEDKTDYELSVNACWPQPGHTSATSHHRPAVVFDIKFDASKNPDMPFSEHWRNRSELKRLADTPWNVDEMLELEEDLITPRFDIDQMWTLLHQTGLYNMGVSDWFLNFNREYFTLHPDDFCPPLISGDQPRIQDAGKVDKDEEMTEGNDVSATVYRPLPLPFVPFVDKAPGTENSFLEYQSITTLDEDHGFGRCSDTSFEELRLLTYKHQAGQSQEPLYPDRPEDEDTPSVFQELLREAGIDA